MLPARHDDDDDDLGEEKKMNSQQNQINSEIVPVRRRCSQPRTAGCSGLLSRCIVVVKQL